LDMTTESGLNQGSGVSVKVEFYGELRRFFLSAVSFALLRQEVASVLGLDPHKELSIKYRDEEGDLITLSSDLELKSAVSPGGILRLFVVSKDASSAVPLVDVNMVDVSLGKAQEPLIQPTPPQYLYPPLEQPQPYVQPPQQPVTDGTNQPFFGPGWCGPNRGFRGGFHGFPGPQPPFHPGFGHHGGPGFGYRGGWGHHGCGRGRYARNGDCAENIENLDALVAQIEQLGFDVKREKIIKLIKKHHGVVEEVANKLAAKKERHDYKIAKKGWKASTKNK